MRILVVTTCPTSEIGGGMARATYELVDALAGSHQVMLLRPGIKSNFIVSQSGAVRIVEVTSLSYSEVLSPDLRRRAWRWLLAALDDYNPDLIHAQDFGPLSMLIQDWAHRKGVPFLLTLHLMPSRSQSFGSEEKPAWMVRASSGGVYRGITRRFLNRCDAVIALNQVQADDLRAFGYTGRIYQVRNGRNLARFGSLAIANIGQPVKRLLFVGSFARRKNQQYLLEVLNLLPQDVHLELLGETLEPGYLAALRHRAAELSLSERVSIGRVTHAEITAHLEAAHLFVSASILEVQSLAVIEALASGTPVVGLANQTIEELVDDSVGHCLAADTPAGEFARIVSEILAVDKPGYQALCSAARERVAGFSWDVVTAQLERVYADLRTVPLPVTRHRPGWTPWLRAASGLLWNGEILLRKLGLKRSPT
ncbi:MAG: glycosyltransferase [Anaerolineae bacterium]